MSAISSGGMSPEFGAIRSRLDAAGNAFRMAKLLGAMGRCVAWVVPVVWGGLLVLGGASLSGWGNLVVLGVMAGTVVGVYAWYLHGVLFTRPTFAQIARWVEEEAARRGEPLDNKLINAVLLARDAEEGVGGSVSAAWIPQVLQEIHRATEGVAIEKSAPWGMQRKAWGVAGVMVLLAVVVGVLFPGVLVHGVAVMGSPLAFVPKLGEVKIVDVTPKSDTLLAGQSVSFTVSVENPAHQVVEAGIELAFASGKKEKFPMVLTGEGNGSYAYTLASIAEDADYVVTAGDSQSAKYHLTVLPQIHVVSYGVTVTAPEYVGEKPRVVTIAGKDLDAGHGSMDVATGSTVASTLTLDLPVSAVVMDMESGSPVAMTANGNLFSTSMVVKETVKYALLLQDSRGRTLKRLPDDSAFFVIHALPDNPPAVVVTVPGRDVDAKPGDTLALGATASDDHGLTEVRLETAPGVPSDAAFGVVKVWKVGGKNAEFGMRNAETQDSNDHLQATTRPVTSVQVRYEMALPASQFKFGDSLRYRFVAVDNRDLRMIDAGMGPQETAGQVFTVLFSDSQAAAEKANQQWEQLEKQLQAILAKQMALRQQAAPLSPTFSIEEAHALAGNLLTGQTGVRDSLNELAGKFPFEAGMKLIQKTLQVLVHEDATTAVDRATEITLVSKQAALGPIATKLRQNQSRIIDVLQTLLAMSASEKDKTASIAGKEGENFPTDARDAWKKMLNDLDKFQKNQKAVVDATADLAKKPKDQFDQNDEKKLADLVANQDKWEKFLNERMVDMSKIAEQDQANASLLDELVQMKVELTASKNALQTKQSEMATALEDNGLELAKGLTTHIERWLSHTPDRTSWQMEEPLTQNDVPMAELPKQLQDMMGDLMDQEEDLTEQMESMGSKSADSLDKGAGWDAADGPISNMSAQGVTGNQMPKDMEIQGRSGEGREGRSSGEFVGKDAEGKGGRRTPTRMTQDPFSTGKVNDTSKEPAGGATGGGKKGGFGGEGLEGPAPDEQHDGLHRLQGAQAALRNEAEKLKLQMHAAQFNNFKLLEAAVLMQKADDALKAYRYHTALYYQKQAVQSLNTAKTLAAGEVHVTLDTTPNASEKTHKDIENAMNNQMPKGYGDPVKAYFEKLSGEGQ